MANMGKGETVTCACRAVGEIVERAHWLDVHEHWFVIRHEGGEVHRVERIRTDAGFRFKEVTG